MNEAVLSSSFGTELRKDIIAHDEMSRDEMLEQFHNAARTLSGVTWDERRR